MRILITVLLISFSAAAAAERSKFFANPDLQGKAPEAFALSEINASWVKKAHEKRKRDAEALFAALKTDKVLFSKLTRWTELPFEERIALLPKVFEIECQVLGITPPELVINTTLYPNRPVNFVYDVNKPGRGLVYLNPDKLKEMDVYAPLAFLLHETRHSYQFQKAFNQESELAKGYEEAFRAQQSLKGFAFSDFLTLLNEYEAFQFGNHMLGLLTNWELDMPGMGTFASQFREKDALKIDLSQLEYQQMSLLEAYNKAAEVQYLWRIAN